MDFVAKFRHHSFLSENEGREEKFEKTWRDIRWKEKN